MDIPKTILSLSRLLVTYGTYLIGTDLPQISSNQGMGTHEDQNWSFFVLRSINTRKYFCSLIKNVRNGMYLYAKIEPLLKVG